MLLMAHPLPLFNPLMGTCIIIMLHPYIEYYEVGTLAVDGWHSCSVRIERTLGKKYAYFNVFYNGYKRTEQL